MSGPKRRPGDVLEVAFVNNMPDQALPATQMQFARLVRAATNGREIRWRCYTLPEVARGERARRYLARSHEEIDVLYRRGADALIVTGCEPRAARIDEEPYWPQMQTLVDWAAKHTLSALWSCLAAHAATFRLAGVERRRAPKKISGVFQFRRCGGDWADDGRPDILVPHSRYNNLSREDLEREGFHIASWSPKIGVNMYWREEPSLFIFLQGHPEYEADTLLKEYRRDVLRFLRGERTDYPDRPENILSSIGSEKLEALRERIAEERARNPAEELSAILAAEDSKAIWTDDAARFYGTWLSEVSERAGIRRRQKG